MQPDTFWGRHANADPGQSGDRRGKPYRHARRDRVDHGRRNDVGVFIAALRKPAMLDPNVRRSGTLGTAIVWIEAHAVRLVVLWLVINSLGLTFTIFRLQQLHLIR
jgi:hypothetical protein